MTPRMPAVDLAVLRQADAFLGLKPPDHLVGAYEGELLEDAAPGGRPPRLNIALALGGFWLLIAAIMLAGAATLVGFTDLPAWPVVILAILTVGPAVTLAFPRLLLGNPRHRLWLPLHILVGVISPAILAVTLLRRN